MRSAPRWVGAIRVSTDEQEVEQQELALNAAASRQGAVIVEWVRIEGESAYDPRSAKEVMRRMLEPVEGGRADTLAVWALDRIVRTGIRETLAFLDRLEKHLGGALFSVTEPFLSTTTMNPEVRDLLASFTAWLANRESARKSERVRAKRDAKVYRAAVLGQNATWGIGVLATPTQLAEAWRLRDTGQSVRAIATAVGVSKSQVSRILERPRPAVPMGPPGQDGVASVAAAPLERVGLGQPDSSAVVAGVQPLEPVRPVGAEEVASRGPGA